MSDQTKEQNNPEVVDKNQGENGGVSQTTPPATKVETEKPDLSREDIKEVKQLIEDFKKALKGDDVDTQPNTIQTQTQANNVQETIQQVEKGSYISEDKIKEIEEILAERRSQKSQNEVIQKLDNKLNDETLKNLGLTKNQKDKFIRLANESGFSNQVLLDTSNNGLKMIADGIRNKIKTVDSMSYGRQYTNDITNNDEQTQAELNKYDSELVRHLGLNKDPNKDPNK